MNKIAHLSTSEWVDDFTLELFANFKHDNYEAVLNTSNPSSSEIVEDLIKLDALQRDAEEFIEVVGEYFTGYSCDHSAVAIAIVFLEKLKEQA